MKLIKPSFEIIPQSEGLDGIYKQIEIAGRTCYKSEDKITDTSAKEFVKRMIKSGHGAMLEHGTVYLTHPIENSASPLYLGIGVKYRENKYSKVNYDTWGTRYITTNYRVLVENDWLDDLQFLCEPTEYHEKRTTVKFICDRGVSHEFVRHRVFSFAQESTRYCNYSKDKFGNELTFIKPCFKAASDSDMDVYNHNIALQNFEYALFDAEKRYLSLLNLGWSPQQARTVLPNSLKTELIMTGFNSDWDKQLLHIIHEGSTYTHTKGFIGLRDDDKAHPQARELAKPLHSELLRLKAINN